MFRRASSEKDLAEAASRAPTGAPTGALTGAPWPTLSRYKRKAGKFWHRTAALYYKGSCNAVLATLANISIENGIDKGPRTLGSGAASG
jgi:hypothetical protein